MTDRFIYFEAKTPTTKEVERILYNFVGGAGELERSDDRWLITLPGRCSATFEGIDGAYPLLPARDERWIEVIFRGGKSLDVLTRQQDDFTCALADGLAQAFARFYQGELEDD